MKNLIFLLILFISLFQNTSQAQEVYKKEYITLIPGAQYELGWLPEIFLGKHWRDLWITPVQVEILDLNRFANGLIPIEKGGGMQTKSLRFKGNDGNIWKFRSMEKDPSKVLPELLRESLAADIVQDQISSANPYAPLVVAPILDSVNILQAKPFLVYLPDSEILGEFREDFGGLLGMIEIHPDVDPDEGIKFQDAENIKSTFKLFHRLEEKRSEKVDSKAFLKARLVDIFLGDWDRHTDQWKWAKYTINDVEYWKPIPRDRDQAFSKFDGIFPVIAEYLVPQFVHFDYDYPQAEDITWNGRYLDRRFLSEIDKKTWDSITVFVYNHLTPTTIGSAIKKLPPEIYPLASEELEGKLLARRKDLSKISHEFYELINDVVEIFCSKKDDYVEVKRLSSMETSVELFRKDKDGNKKGEPYYSKLVDNNFTSEIRIEMLEGDDKAILSGEVEDSPLIRIIGGEGKDEFEDNSLVKGRWLFFTPFRNAENKTEFYDSGDKSKFISGDGTVINQDKYPKPKDDFERFEPKLRDRGTDWMINPIIGLDTDNGIIVGLGPMVYNYDFRADPYDFWMTLTGEYATKPRNGRLMFSSIFNSIVKNGAFHLDISWSGLSFTKYYGYGNETGFDSDLEDMDYYKLNDRLFTVSPHLSLNLSGKSSLHLGFSYKGSHFKFDNEILLTAFPNKNYGLGRFKTFNLELGFQFDSRDNAGNAKEGIFFDLMGNYFPELLDVREHFIKTKFDLRGFLTAKTFTDITLALRFGGGKIWGNYPFFDGLFLGGFDNLRGYNRERFAGDAALFAQSEMRIELATLNFIMPSTWGIYGFIESGRVFARNEDSKKWHPDFGGGIYSSVLKRLVSFSLAAAKSEERLAFYIQINLMF